MFKFKKEYKISISSDDWVAPEETLLDSGSQHSDIEKPIPNSVFSFTFVAACLVAGVLFIFTAKLSVVNYKHLASLSFQNSTANFFIPPPRGLIFDRNEIVLVKNVPSFDLLVISREIKDASVLTAANLSKLATILKMPEEEFKHSISEQSGQSSIFIAAENLTKEQLLEITYISPRGFYVVPNIKRNYIDGHQFSQIIGYIGKVNKDDLRDRYYKPTDVIGRLGLEAQYEKYLRGEHGTIFFKEDGSENQDPKSGRNLVLSIDYELQKKLYSSLFEALKVSNIDKASAVIQNPQTGEILAMVSFPDYDNNSFISGLSQKDFERFFKNKSKPLFNRVISGLYNPGSTIKPFLAMAILEEGIFTPTDNIRDCVNLILPNPYDPDNPAIFGNWRAEHGLFNLRKAMANSCNIYFFIGGGGYKDIKGLGVEKIAKYLGLSLADKKLGIDLPAEEKGFVPTPNWKHRETGEGWYQGDTYNISIGQGDLLVTPLWINSYVSAIANGGTLLKPRLVNKITDQNKNIIASFDTQELTDLPFNKDNINEVRSAMEETVLSGTAQLLKDIPVRIGAKTGTAEVIKGSRVNSLITAFAPFENPKLTITILVEDSGRDQGIAVRTAHNVLKWYFTESLVNNACSIEFLLTHSRMTMIDTM